MTGRGLKIKLRHSLSMNLALKKKPQEKRNREWTIVADENDKAVPVGSLAGAKAYYQIRSLGNVFL